MYIAEIIGTVVATRKSPNMEGLPLRIVRKIGMDLAPSAVYAVAVDVVGASEGELVLVTAGSPARQTHLTDNRPTDALIMAIVDTWQVDHAVIYTKGS